MYKHSQPISRAALAGLLLLMAAAWVPFAQAQQSLLKSPADQRDYRYVALDNGLRAVVVSDPDSRVAAASMDVDVGSGDDPPGREGLAHFLEHMLFLGTDRFPAADEYQRFMGSNGGNQNAYTAYDRTNFHFEVRTEALRGALERFSRFFIAPAMDAQYVDRERQVVHAEYSAGLRNDARRSYSAFKQALNPAHPLSRFFVGSTETLADRPGDAVREDLLAFHAQHYRAANMTLAILGRESLDELERTVRALFAEVPTGMPEQAPVRPALFVPGSLPMRLNIVPEREYRSVSLAFPVPWLTPHYRIKPMQYISHLLGHEGPGSLTALLRERGLANSLSTGPGLNYDDGLSTFRVRIGLTEDGLARLDEVVGLVFATIRLIRDSGPQAFRYEELQRMSALSFKFMEPAEPGQLTQALAHGLHDYPVSDLLYAGYALDRFDPDLTWRYLDQLRPDNLLLTVTAPGLPVDSRTPFFDAPYSRSAIDAASRERWRAVEAPPTLHLPEPNRFIPEDTRLLSGADGAAPQLIESQPGFALWHQQDTSFGVPHAGFFVNLRTPLANASARDEILARLAVAMLNEQLSEDAYPAAIAGLGVQLYKHLRGVSFRITGYSDKQAELVRLVAAALRAPDLAQRRFERVRAAMRRALANQEKAAPYTRALGYLSDLLLVPRWPREQRIAALDSVTRDDLQAYVARWLDTLDVVALAHGNIDADAARALAATLRAALPDDARFEKVQRARVVRLNPSDHFRRVLQVPHSDRALVVYLQGRSSALQARARVALLAQMMSGAFYNDLRTEKQLGYIVFATSMPLIEVPGLALVVQSPDTDTEALRTYVDAFLAGFGGWLRQVPQAEFERHRSSLQVRLLEPDKTLGERTARYWNELDRHPGQFDERQRLAAAVAGVQRDDLQAALEQLADRDQQARVDIHVVPAGELPDGEAQRPEAGVAITSFERLRAIRGRFPPTCATAAAPASASAAC